MAPPRYAVILISPHGVAHLAGKCNPHPYKSHRAAGRGGGMEPDEGVWEGISRGNPLQATHGDAVRVAWERCGHWLM